MLLTAHLLALAVACLIFGVMLFLHRRGKAKIAAPVPSPTVLFQHAAPLRPTTWLAIRAATPTAVQNALGLNRSTPCSWTEGMSGEHEFFISQRIHGWVIVTGAGLPSPDDDVDACFLFLIAMSRKLGHVQFFHAENFSHHHAWARLDDGYVTRAYAWAGETVWNQGAKTAAEIEFKMKCLPYGEELFSEKVVELNCDKVPLLATRWSLDPARVRMLKKMDGIAGQSSQVF
jgi:hypothetical protein